MKAPWLALIASALLFGCTHPCEVTAQCGDGESCVAATCQAVSCETPVLLRDPQSGACVALSGCFLNEAQKAWKSCAEDPCATLGESACLGDRRCQPVYQDATAAPPGKDPTNVTVACGGVGQVPVAPGNSPGVNNGTSDKHHRTLNDNGCLLIRSRAFTQCRAVPQVAEQDRPQRSCEALTTDQCRARRDCEPLSNQGAPDIFPTPPRPGVDFLGQCRARVALQTGGAACSGSDASSCLLNPDCQPVGTRCFCPPGVRCECGDGTLLSCQENDRLRRCSSNAECGADERCDNDEACSEPRTFTDVNDARAVRTPGQPGCVGACVPKGCAGLGEGRCSLSAGCDGGSYGTVCRPKPYCSGGGDILVDDRSGAPATDPSNACGCETEFQGCAEQKPLGTVKAERSLLIRDPEIVEAPSFRIDQVLTRLAPAGQADEFVRRWFTAFTTIQGLGNGAIADARPGFGEFIGELSSAGQLSAAGLAQRYHTTALVNRLDLAGPKDCGEARITFALNSAYENGDRRMTVIVELGVPDDGAGCRTVAQRWAELSLVDDGAERLRRLQAIYDGLLTPARLKQIRTNEFQNRKGIMPWELREWHLGQDGMPQLAPVAQTVSAQTATSPDLLSWLRQNRAGVLTGTATVPTVYLAAVSTEDGGRVRLPTDMADLEKPLNLLACAGCHLTETRSPFVHVGERLAQKLNGRYVPTGRAVIDDFMKNELVKRAAHLESVLAAPAAMAQAAAWRNLPHPTH